ncbi:membrane protein [Psychroserpens mesophilus]|uniref:membrane protein n=1 Tax=Psychroserpens mesophilus TaxID=325473 RepID=UPI00058BA4D6|nr:membrane protein [Psychroserpens mesophilus]
MRVLKTVFDFYINSSIHVALAIVAMTCVTYLEFNVSIDSNLLCFVGFASITGYNFVKYFGLAKFHHRSLSNKLKAIQVFSLLCFLAMCFFALRLNTASLIAILIFGAVTFLYAIPLLPNRIFVDKKKKLRSISGLKIYIIALVWSGVTVCLPLINNEFEIFDDVIISAVQRFIFVVLLMLPFEIRDLNYDSLKLSTIPQRIGVRSTKVAGLLLSLVLVSLEYFKNNIHINHLLSLIGIVLVSVLFLKFSTQQQGKYYSAFWVESLPIFWLLVLLVLS